MVFCMQADYKHSYKLCVAQRLEVNSYKQGRILCPVGLSFITIRLQTVQANACV
jgi:hypothetical protein